MLIGSQTRWQNYKLIPNNLMTRYGKTLIFRTYDVDILLFEF